MKVPKTGWSVVLGACGTAMAMNGCVAFHPEDPPELASDLPEQYSPGTAAAADPGRWWEEFEDHGLNQFIDDVLTDNPSVLETWAP